MFQKSSQRCTREQQQQPEERASNEAPTAVAAVAGVEPGQSVLTSAVATSGKFALDKAVPPAESVSGAVEAGDTPNGKVRAFAAALEKANSSEVAPVAYSAVGKPVSVEPPAAADMEPRHEPEPDSTHLGGVRRMAGSVVAAADNSIEPEANVSTVPREGPPFGKY